MRSSSVVVSSFFALCAGCLSWSCAPSPAHESEEKTAQSALSADRPGESHGVPALAAASPGTGLGEAGVDVGSGTLQYELSLPDLPARGGFAPQLGVRHLQGDDASGSGLGQGFGLTVSSVSVSTESGVPYPTVRTDTGDVMARLALDGVRLIWEKVETVTEDGASRRRVVYRPETDESFLRASRYRDGGSLRFRSGGVERTLEFKGFLVEKPDGSKDVYTEDPAEAEGLILTSGRPFPVRWPLKYQLSPVGDLIEYQYEVDADQRSYLRRVTFGGGRSEYVFHRRLRSPQPRAYTLGFAQGNDSVYTRVQARFDGRTVATVCWVYGAVSGDQPTVLADPQCSGLARSDFADYLAQRGLLPAPERLLGVYELGEGEGPFDADSPREPLLRFGYSAWTHSLIGESASVATIQVPGVTGFGPSGGSQFLDLSSDGLPDIVGYSPAERQGLVALNGGDDEQGSLFTRLPALSLSRVDGGVVRSSLVRFDEASSDDGIFMPGDYDADGLNDVVQVTKESASGKARLWLARGRASGDGLDAASSSWLSDLSFGAFGGGRAVVSDLNADGRDDVLMASADGKTLTALVNTTARGSTKLQFSPLTGLGLPFVPTGLLNLADPAYRFQDMNGDGLVDWVTLRLASGGEPGICVYENRGGVNTDPFTTTVRAPAAVKAPGVTERPGLLFGSNEPPNAGTCGAGRFVPVPSIATVTLNGVWLLDVNRDELVDLVNLSADRTQLEVWFAESAAAFRSKQRLSLGGASVTVDLENKWNTRIADLDGDGAAEIVVFERDGGGRLRVIDLNRAGAKNLVRPGLLTSAESQLGAAERFQYAHGADEMVRDRRLGLGDGKPWVAAGATVLKRRWRGGAEGEPSVEELRYHKPSWDAVARSPGGFAEVEQLVHGGDGGAATLTTTTFTRIAGRAARRLASRPQRELVSEVASDGLALAALPSAETAAASLTQESRRDVRYRAARNLLETVRDWQLSPANPSDDEVAFVRIASETLKVFGDSGTESTTTRRSSYEAKYNRVSSLTTEESAVSGPAQVSIPARRRTERTDYDAAWEARGVVMLPSQRTLTDESEQGRSVLLEQETFTYAADRPLTVKRTTLVQTDLTGLPEVSGLPRPIAREQLRATGYTYDAYGNIASVTDDVGLVGKVDYDLAGLRPIGAVDPLGLRTTYCYGTAGCPLDTPADWDVPGSSVDRTHEGLPNGRVQLTSYDARHRPRALRTFEGAAVSLTYRELPGQGSRVLSELLAPGSSVRARSVQGFDSLGQASFSAEEVDGGRARVTASSKRDRRGNVTFQSAPWLSTQSLEELMASSPLTQGTTCGEDGACAFYDALDREIAGVSADGSAAWELAREAWGRQRTEVNTSSQDVVVSTTTAIGRDGELLAWVDEAGNVTTFERDAWSHVRTTKLPDSPASPSGLRRHWVSSNGEVVATSLASDDSLGATHLIARDLRGRPVAERTRSRDGSRWTQVERDFDVSDRVVASRGTDSDSPSAVERQEFRYDHPEPSWDPASGAEPVGSLGQLVEQTNHDPRLGATVTERFRHDAAGRVVDRSLEVSGGPSYRARETWSHGSDGLVREYSDALGNTFTPRYDTEGELSELLWRGVAAEVPLLTNLRRDAFGEVASFDDLPARVRHVRTSKRETGWLMGSRVCRLGSPCTADPGADSPKPLVSHAYARRGDGTLESEEDETGLLTRYHYDLRGALTLAEQPGAQYHYRHDGRGQLTAFDEGGATERAFGPGDVPSLPKSAGFEVDTLGRVVRTPVHDELSHRPNGGLRRVVLGAKTVDYLFGADGMPVAKRVSEAGAARWLFYPGSDQVDDGTSRTHRIDLGGSPVALVRNEREVRALDEDQRGGIAAILDEHSVVYRARYTPYGTPSELPMEDAELLGPFAGQVLDPDTHLVRMGARSYAPAYGVFLTPDALLMRDAEACVVDPKTCNAFAYAGLDPVNYVDPSGENPALLAGLARAARFARPAAASAARRPGAVGRPNWARMILRQAFRGAQSLYKSHAPVEYSSRQRFATTLMSYAYGGVEAQVARQGLFQRGADKSNNVLSRTLNRFVKLTSYASDFKNDYAFRMWGSKSVKVSHLRDYRNKLRAVMVKRVALPALQKVLGRDIKLDDLPHAVPGDGRRKTFEQKIENKLNGMPSGGYNVFRWIFSDPEVAAPEKPAWPFKKE